MNEEVKILLLNYFNKYSLGEECVWLVKVFLKVEEKNYLVIIEYKLLKICLSFVFKLIRILVK